MLNGLKLHKQCYHRQYIPVYIIFYTIRDPTEDPTVVTPLRK